MSNFTTFGSAGSSGGSDFPVYGQTGADLSSPEGLYQLAQDHGGAVAQAANEIYHPTTGILSTIGNGFKNAFSGFVNTLAVSSEVIAGIIDPNMSISDAVKTHERVSDVIFGKENPDGSTMQKVGNFVVRTAVDILTDPTTYITFGGSAGIFGLKGLQKISLGAETASAMGLVKSGEAMTEVFTKAVSAGAGSDLLKYGNLMVKQAGGKIGLEKALANFAEKNNVVVDGINVGKQYAEELKSLTTNAALQKAKDAGIRTVALDFEGEAFKKLMAETLDSPLNIDFAKRAMNNLLEKAPALAETYLDKGGIKLFGKTVLSAQRIGSVMEMVPGMTALDHLTKPTRMALGSFFNPAIIKVGNEYQRIPEEMVGLMQKAKDFKEVSGVDMLTKMSDVMNQNQISKDELGILMDAISSRKLPADARLATAYTHLLDLNAQTKAFVEARGGSVSNLDNYVGLFLKPEQVKNVSYGGKASGKIGSSEMAQNAKFIAQTGQDVLGAKSATGAMEAVGRHITSAEQVLKYSPTADVAGLISQTQKNIVLGIQDTSPEIAKAVESMKSSDFKTVQEFSKAVNDVVKSFETQVKITPLEKTLSNIPDGQNLIDAIRGSKSVQEAGYALGNHTDKLLQSLRDSGLSIEQALANKDIQELIKIRSGIDLLPKNTPLIGSIEGNLAEHGLKAIEKDGYFMSNKEVIFKRVATTAKELESVGITGFDTNLATSMSMRFLQNANQSITLEFLQNFGRNFGRPAAEAPSGWVRLAVTKANEAAQHAFGAQDIMFHPTMAAAAEGMFKTLNEDPTSGAFLKYFDKLNTFWKGSVTSIFPQFHGRNAISNVLLNYLDLGYHAFNPATHTASIDLLNKDQQANKLARLAIGSGEQALNAKKQLNELLGKTVFTDAKGEAYTFGELRRVVKEQGVAFSRDITGQIDVFNERERLFEALSYGAKSTAKKVLGAANPLSTENIAMKTGRRVGNYIESQARLVNFLSNLRATGDVTYAAQRTKQFLFDYSNLTNFEKSFLKRVIPFYTFTRKNLELQVNTLLTTPGRIESELTALHNLGDALSGGNMTDEEKANLPDWVKSGIGVLADRKGSTVSILTGFGTPIEQPFSQFQPNVLLGSISPLIRVPVEQMSGYSFFQGKLLSDVTNAAGFKDAPDAIKQVIGYTELKGKKSDGTPFKWYVSLNPSTMNLILNMPFVGRTLSSIKQIDTQDIAGQYKILQQTVGIRPYSFDLVREQEKRQNEMKAKLEDILTKAGVTAKFTKTFIPKAQ